MTASLLRIGIVVAGVAGLSVLRAAAAEGGFTPPPAEQILKTLKAGHPRLLIDADTAGRVKRLIERDAIAAAAYKSVKAEVGRVLKQPPSRYEIPDGKRLLRVSRRVKDRVRVLAFVHRMEGGRRYVDRVWKELEAAAKFKDWNPSHFLDTAEMTHAFAIGYDWLYDEWTDAQRRALREAIIRHGLTPAMKLYKAQRGWVTGHNNWNQVCNGGIGMGALAIADEQPEAAAAVLHAALASLPRAMSLYAPDGAGAEGVTYWDYGARYNILLMASLDTALGTDFGLSVIDGFRQSGNYQIYMSGAGRMSFNFADCGLRRVSTPMHFWMGRRYKTPHYSWYRYSSLRAQGSGTGGVLDLLWFDDSAKAFDPAALPPDKHFRKVDCASMRSAWGDPNALALGIQAGSNHNLRMHRHLDLGSFILEADGVRWAADSGSERETYMRHKHRNPRWYYYRVRAEGHNTLVINPTREADQDPAAAAPITRFESSSTRAVAVVDLTAAYAKHGARRVHRTFEMTDRSAVTIADEVRAAKPAEVWWFMHTEAAVRLGADRRVATLSRGGKKLTATIQAPAAATFEVLPAEPMPASPKPRKQADNRGRRKLAVHLRDVRDVKLVVRLRGRAGPVGAPGRSPARAERLRGSGR